MASWQRSRRVASGLACRAISMARRLCVKKRPLGGRHGTPRCTPRAGLCIRRSASRHVRAPAPPFPRRPRPGLRLASPPSSRRVAWRWRRQKMRDAAVPSWPRPAAGAPPAPRARRPAAARARAKPAPPGVRAPRRVAAPSPEPRRLRSSRCVSCPLPVNRRAHPRRTLSETASPRRLRIAPRALRTRASDRSRRSPSRRPSGMGRRDVPRRQR